MQRALAACAALFIAACASPPFERSAATMDSGRPMSERLAMYEVVHYDITTDIDVAAKSIQGRAAITIRAREEMDILELDFDGQFTITSVGGWPYHVDTFGRTDDKLMIPLPNGLPAGDEARVWVEYEGVPHEALRPPWQGGFTWAKTPSGKPWIATSFQGEGCDLWFPCKDHPDGEPGGLDLRITVDHDLVAVLNGVLVNVESTDDGRKTYHWRTEVPTNTYGIALNVGPYVLIENTYTSTNGTVVPVKFWAIEDRQEQARDLFEREFIPVTQWFEKMVGPYPWGQEKLGVVETPHLGMEHQTVNAYGNYFRRDDYGFDWLFHHEIAHEWFGNVMTHKTVSDLWLHEGFGAYMQPMYTLELMGAAAFHARMYDSYLRINACNAIAPRQELSADELYFDDQDGTGPAGDIYTKGSWVLQSLRYVVGDDKFWQATRILVYDTPNPELLKPPIAARFRSTDDFVKIASDVYGEDLGWFFEVYARQGALPVLDSEQIDEGVQLIWRHSGDVVFPMPLPVAVNGELRRIEFDGNRAVIPGVDIDEIDIDPLMQILRKLPTVPTCEERRAETGA
ncbi:MAG: M1 family metallopeptidase [Pseudomonadota bacterium]